MGMPTRSISEQGLYDVFYAEFRHHLMRIDEGNFLDHSTLRVDVGKSFDSFGLEVKILIRDSHGDAIGGCVTIDEIALHADASIRVNIIAGIAHELASKTHAHASRRARFEPKFPKFNPFEFSQFAQEYSGEFDEFMKRVKASTEQPPIPAPESHAVTRFSDMVAKIKEERHAV